MSSPATDDISGAVSHKPCCHIGSGSKYQAALVPRLVILAIMMIAAMHAPVFTLQAVETKEEYVPADAVLHLRHYLSIAFVTSLVLLIGGACVKLLLEADKKEPKLSATQRWALAVVRHLSHEIGIALFVAFVVSALFEYTVRVAETAEREQKHRELMATMARERNDLMMAFDKERSQQKEAYRRLDASWQEEHEDQQQELKENVFKAVFAHAIDPDVIKEVMESVFESPLTRHNLEINCHLCRPDKARKGVRLRVEVKYHLKNAISRTVYLPNESGPPSKPEARERHEIRASFENLEPGEPNTDYFSSFTVSDEQLKPIFALSESELADARGKAVNAFKRLLQEEQSGVVVKRPTSQGLSLRPVSDNVGEWAPSGRDGDFEYYYGARRQSVVMKKGVPIEPGHAIIVDFVYELTKRESDTLDVYSPMPTTSFQFAVSKGEGASNLHVAVQSTHRQQPVRLMPNLQREGPGETYEYEIPTALLPGQLVELSWYPSDVEIKHDQRKGIAAGR